MFFSIFNRIQKLRTPVRSLLYLFWIYVFVNSLVSTFIQIAIFKMFSNLQTNIIAVMFSFTGIMFGFCVFGYILSHYRLDAKQGFYYSFISFAAGILILSQVTTIPMAYLATFMYGLGGGFFWLTIHTYELTETKDEERDFYSSILSSGQKLIQIIGPLFATGIIWVSLYVLHVSSFALLFVVAPLFYLLGLFCFKGMQDYRPVRIEFEDITHFFSEKRNRFAQIYIAGGGIQHFVGNVVAPLALFYILGTELHVGVYSTVAACISLVLVFILGHFRNKRNRMFLFGVSAVGISLLNVILGYNLTFIALIIFTIGETILKPIMNVSDHVVALQTMESIGRTNRDFYATMILRDFSLWVYRMLAGVILLLISLVYNSTEQILSVGLYMIAGAILLTFIGAKILVQKMK